MSQYKLIIKDSEFEDAGSQLKAYCFVMQETVKQYKQIMENLANTAVSSGAVHDAIVCYTEYVTKLETITQDLGERCQDITKNYIIEIEQADDYLYDAGVANIARDFSDEEYEHLLSCLDDPWCDVTDSIGDWFLKGIDWLGDTFNWDGAKKFLQDSRRLLLDYNDATEQEIKVIFNNVKTIDRKYGSSIAGAAPGDRDYYTSNFDNLAICLCCIRDLLDSMAEVIEPKNGCFTVSGIKDRLGDAYKELLYFYDQTMDIRGPEDQATIPEISDFASQPWADSYFNPFLQPMSDYIADVGGIDAFKMIIFNMFGIAKDTLLAGDYDVYIAKKQLMEVLDGMMDNYDYSSSDEKDTIDDARDFLGYYKKYGKEWYEYMNTHRGENGKLLLDGRTTEARQFREFLDSLGNAGDILKYGSKGIDYLSQLFADYQKGQEVLDSFEKNYAGDPVLDQAVNEIQSLYRKEFEAWANKALLEIEKIGIDEGLSALGKAVPVVAVVNAIGETLDLGGEILGVGEQAKGMYDSLLYFNLTNASTQAYREALEKFQAADPSAENYDILARDVQNCFNLNKANLVELYKSMEKSATGDKQAYYHYCYKQADLMTMHDKGKPSILTYEEFLALNP